MADLVAQVLTNIQAAIKEIQEKITTDKVVKMRLYKITQKYKMYYNFTADINNMRNRNDLTLSNQQSIKMRVFKTREEAESHKNIMVWRRELRRSNW